MIGGNSAQEVCRSYALLIHLIVWSVVQLCNILIGR